MTAHKAKANELVIFDTVEKTCGMFFLLWYIKDVIDFHERCACGCAQIKYFSNEKGKGTRGNP